MNSELRRCIIVSGKPEFFQMDLPGRKRMLGSQEQATRTGKLQARLEIFTFNLRTLRPGPGKLQASAWSYFTFCLRTLRPGPGKLQASAWRCFAFCLRTLRPGPGKLQAS